MNSPPFRVLSLDGGGIRGLYTASLLQQLAVRAARFHKLGIETRLDVGALFDLVVGTSTGSILATALAAGVPLEDIVNLYRHEARSIFQRPMPLQAGGILDKWKAGVWAVQSTLRPANSSCALRQALHRVLGEETLEELYARRNVGLCVPSVKAETRRAWVFKTPHVQRLTRDNNYRLVDVCLASAAAPIYFPMHRAESPDAGSTAIHTFVDGGLWANDPVLVALVEALEVAAPDQRIEVLSIGTCPGGKSQILGEEDATRGVIGWRGGTDIVSMSLEAQASVTHYLAQKLSGAMGSRVTLHRLAEPTVSPEESKHLALDAVDKKSLDLLEMLGQRATDLNMSALTNSPNPTPGHAMTLAIFSCLKQLTREQK